MGHRTKELPALTGIAGVVRELRYHEVSRQGIGLLLMPLYALLAQPVETLFVAGVLFSVLGAVVRLYASGFIMKNQQLATEGPYSLVRHPLYTGNLLLLIGFTLASGLWWAALLSAWFWWFYYPPAIEYEDRKLRRIFGEHCARWQLARPALPSETPVEAPPARAGTWRLLASGYQGAVYLVEAPGGAVIVKKASGCSLLRAARRAMLRREHGIYQRLRGIAGVPECKGLEQGEHLLLEFIHGPSLRVAQPAPAERERFFAELRDLILAVHGAGVAHGDLKRKDNILMGPGNRPYLIDFGTAVACPPGAGLLRRLLFRQLRRMDLNAWVKLKYQRQNFEVDPADLQFFRPTLVERIARVVRRVWRAATFRRWRKGVR